VGVVVAQVLATCTNQSNRRALVTECHYACCGTRNIMLRTWSFVLKQRGLGHEGWRGGKRKCLVSISATRFALRTAPMYEDQLGPLRSGEVIHTLARIFFDYELNENRAPL
jgi:hypothetical protein